MKFAGLLRDTDDSRRMTASQVCIQLFLRWGGRLPSRTQSYGVTVFHSAANVRQQRFLEIIDHPAGRARTMHPAKFAGENRLPPTSSNGSDWGDGPAGIPETRFHFNRPPASPAFGLDGVETGAPVKSLF